FALPSGFSVLVSLDRQMVRTVYLRSDLSPPESVEALRQAFVVADWTLLETPDASSFMPQRGFFNSMVVNVGVPPNAMLCRQNEGNLQITASPLGDYTVVRANHFAFQTNQ